MRKRAVLLRAGSIRCLPGCGEWLVSPLKTLACWLGAASATALTLLDMDRRYRRRKPLSGRGLALTGRREAT